MNLDLHWFAKNKEIVLWAQVVLSILGAIFILLQNRSSSGSTVLSVNGGETYGVRRGLEVILLYLTTFVIISMVALIYIQILA